MYFRDDSNDSNANETMKQRLLIRHVPGFVRVKRKKTKSLRTFIPGGA
jgi:hypothetical protein